MACVLLFTLISCTQEAPTASVQYEVTLFPTNTAPVTPTENPTASPTVTFTLSPTPPPPPTETPAPTDVPSPTAPPPALPPQLTAQIDQLAVATLEQSSIAGMTIGIRRGNITPLIKAYGYADLARRVPARGDTRYMIASLTKQFTAAAIMQLVEQDKINVDDPVSRYISGLPKDWQVITLRQLLNHTSGIPEYTSLDSSQVDLNAARAYQPSILIAQFASLNLPLAFAPGSRYSYTNSDYILLGEIIEKVSGLAYGDYLRQYVTGPLGLGTAYATKLPADLAKGYQDTANGLELADYLDPSYIYSAGGMISSAGDLLNWQQALASGRVVGQKSYMEMTTPGTLTNGDATTYGYGFMIATRNGHKAIFHEGAINGYLSMLVYYPDQDLALVLLANTIPAAFLAPLQALEAHITALVLATP